MKSHGRVVALFLVCAIVAFSAIAPAKERRGAGLIVQKVAGEEIKGELIAVKQNSLLLMESGKDVSIELNEIRSITVVRKSKVLLWTSLGLLAGGAGGTLLGYAYDEESSGTVIGKDAAKNALLYGIIGSAIGAVAGAIIGSSKGKNEIYQIESNPMMQQLTLQKLRYDARFPDYR